MSATGFVIPAISIGLGSLLIKPKRGFFLDGEIPIIAQITLEEMHNDELMITTHPVEQGAPITDHAYKLPSEVIITCAWSNSPTKSPGLFGTAVDAILNFTEGTANAVQSILNGNDSNQAKDIYQQLLALQESRVPFDILTGKRSYTSMLFKSLRVHTDKTTENCLMVVAVCQQVIIVNTQTVVVPINTLAQGLPQKTTPTQNAGQQQLRSAPNFKDLDLGP